jgi:four helix bundle protein
MPMAENYRDLIAWQKAKSLVLSVYRCTRLFPRDEIYGLTSQMRRAAVSVPSNIAEGKGRNSQRELVQFLFHARGSLLELETQLSIAYDLEYIELPVFETLESQTRELGRILNGLINRFQPSIERVS